MRFVVKFKRTTDGLLLIIATKFGICKMNTKRNKLRLLNRSAPDEIDLWVDLLKLSQKKKAACKFTADATQAPI